MSAVNGRHRYRQFSLSRIDGHSHGHGNSILDDDGDSGGGNIVAVPSHSAVIGDIQFAGGVIGGACKRRVMRHHMRERQIRDSGIACEIEVIVERRGFKCQSRGGFALHLRAEGVL